MTTNPGILFKVFIFITVISLSEFTVRFMPRLKCIIITNENIR